MSYLTYSIIISLSINTLILITPLTLGINILLLSIITAFAFAFFNSSWIAFLIFLIYIRGTLVIFSYFVAITPNITISTTFQVPLIIIFPIILTSIFYLTKPEIAHKSIILQINTFYSKFITPSLIIIAIILLFTIIVVVKISSSNKGPLRPFSYA
jgi:hypothetical protein